MVTLAKVKSFLSATSSESNKSYIKEYCACILFFGTLFALLSIATFNPKDPSAFHTIVQRANKTYRPEINNVFGTTGATVAEAAYQVFGVCSLLLSFVFLIQFIGVFRKPNPTPRFWLKMVGLPQMIACSLGLAHCLKPEWRVEGVTYHTGGVVGLSIFQWLAQYLGKTGAGFTLFFGFVSSLPLALGIRPLHFLSASLEKIPFKKFKKLAVNLADDSSSFVKEKVLAAGSTLTEALTPTLQEPSSFGPDTFVDPAPAKSGVVEEEATQNSLPYFSPSEVSFDNIGSSQTYSQADFNILLSLLDDLRLDPELFDPAREEARLNQEARLIEEKLASFGVEGRVSKSEPGPVVCVHDFEPAAGIKVTRVLALQEDLALTLKAQGLMMSPQPGRSSIAIEVPRKHREPVSFKEILNHSTFRGQKGPLPIALGKHVDGSPLVVDLSSMPHLLVAGATGSGKSVGINSMLLSLLLTKSPQELRLILVDPKMLELSGYDGIGHLLMPVVTDPKKAAGALRWAIHEMDRRYNLMKNLQVRNITSYNEKLTEIGEKTFTDQSGCQHEILPFIVVVVDELCDLMMTAPKDVEDCIQRLAQKARASGIHLILATQRPSVDVLTGVIKANLPCRISFQVTSKHDSRTIIETIGAEKLLGKGDMLFLPPGTSKIIRAHGAYVSDPEINRITKALQASYPAQYEQRVMKDVDTAADMDSSNERRGFDNSLSNSDDLDDDLLYEKTLEFAQMSGVVSTSSIQRQFRVGYNKAARIMDRLEKEGVVGPSEVAGKPRKVNEDFLNKAI